MYIKQRTEYRRKNTNIHTTIKATGKKKTYILKSYLQYTQLVMQNDFQYTVSILNITKDKLH